MTNIQKKIATATVLTVLAVIGLYGTVVFVSASLDKSEIVECMKLKQYSKEYESFFLTEWQNEMCVTHGIRIYAPVEIIQ